MAIAIADHSLVLKIHYLVPMVINVFSLLQHIFALPVTFGFSVDLTLRQLSLLTCVQEQILKTSDLAQSTEVDTYESFSKNTDGAIYGRSSKIKMCKSKWIHPQEKASIPKL